MNKAMTTHTYHLLRFPIYILGLLLCTSNGILAQDPDPVLPALIPVPKTMVPTGNSFIIEQGTPILLPNQLEGTPIHKALNELMYTTTWLNGEVIFYEGSIPSITQTTSIDSAILVLLHSPENLLNDPDQEHLEHEEGYRIHVSSEQLTLEATTEHGLFNAIMTLRQLLPTEVEKEDPSRVRNNMAWTVPGVHIADHPRFQYRGLHLDVGRHFMPVSFIKHYIDLLAMHKMNRFHWHLTEDQGWRIEIKAYPKLTEIAAFREETLIRRYGSNTYDNRPYGGFYTQEEIKEVVAYAADNYITVVPEIEMPGHTSAVLAAYPEYGCLDKEYKVQTTWGVFEDIFCPSEETFGFLEDVLDEVMALFPGEFIHIGGDEAPKKQWGESALAQEVIRREGLKDEHELQSYFITRIERYLNSKGRQIIGWDEILEGGLAPRATVMSWRGERGGIEAAKMGHDVIMTPGNTNYFDHYQGTMSNEPLAICCFTSVEDVYGYEPVPEALSQEEAKHVLGAQGNVWTEYIRTPEKVEYMAYPRATALSEVLWSDPSQKDWYSFWARLQHHFERLDHRGVNYAPHYEGQLNPHE